MHTTSELPPFNVAFQRKALINNVSPMLCVVRDSSYVERRRAEAWNVERPGAKLGEEWWWKHEAILLLMAEIRLTSWGW